MTQTPSPAPHPTAEAEPGGDVPAAIERALVAASGLLSEERARQLAQLNERWRARRFVTIIAGEFKRGKSTLLNPLAGVDVLLTGVLPVTTVPTRVAHGPRESACVLLRDGSQRETSLTELRHYVDESRNPGNRLAVASVEVRLATGLPPGVVLVDVPGPGSVHQHNTETALLPRRVALRRLAAQAVEVAEGRYGRAVEQTRESLLRAYDADFRSLTRRFDEVARETASAVDAALRAAQARVGEIDRLAQGTGRTDEARRRTLQELQGALRQVEESA